MGEPDLRIRDSEQSKDPALPSGGPGASSKDLHNSRRGNQGATSRIRGGHRSRLIALLHPRLRRHGRSATSGEEQDDASTTSNGGGVLLRRVKRSGISDLSDFWRMVAAVATRNAGHILKRCWRQHQIRPISPLSEIACSTGSISMNAAAREEVGRLLDAVKAYRSPKSEQALIEQLAELVRLIGEGYDIPELADRLHVARCTVYRWIELVKRIGECAGIALQAGEAAP